MGPVVNNLSGLNQIFRCARPDFTGYHLEKSSRSIPSCEGIIEHVSATGSRAIKDTVEHTCSIKADGSFSASSTFKSAESVISPKFFASAGSGGELTSSSCLPSQESVSSEAASQIAASSTKEPVVFFIKFIDGDVSIKCDAGTTLGNVKRKLAELFMRELSSRGIRSVTVNPEDIDIFIGTQLVNYPDELMDDLKEDKLRVCIQSTGGLDKHPTTILKDALKKLGWKGWHLPTISLDLFTP